MDFGAYLQAQRSLLGLTQADVAGAAGIARPNIAAYEANRREPTLSTASRLLAAVSSRLTLTPTINWTWTDGLRPYAVPSQLWRLPIQQALATITTNQAIWWSGPDRVFDLSDTRQRRRAYEIILREGVPEDIESIVDGLLLVDLWSELVLPTELRQAWCPIVDSMVGTPDAPAA
ncbi:MAG: helix-turn-helix transcriptional regulator [Actinomycetota bacterium]